MNGTDLIVFVGAVAALPGFQLTMFTAQNSEQAALIWKNELDFYRNAMPIDWEMVNLGLKPLSEHTEWKLPPFQLGDLELSPLLQPVYEVRLGVVWDDGETALLELPVLAFDEDDAYASVVQAIYDADNPPMLVAGMGVRLWGKVTIG